MTAWPLYRLALRKFNSPSAGLAIAFCALAYPPLGFLNRADFHAEVIAVPLLVATYERLDAEDLKTAAIFMALALLGKESIGLSVAALGLFTAIYQKHWLFGLIWTTVGSGYSLVALFWVIPAFRDGPSDTLARYQWMGSTPFEMLATLVSNPSLVAEKMLVGANHVTAVQLLGPVAFLPLLHLPTLLPAVPAILYNFASDLPQQKAIYHQYMAPVIPFVLLAGVLGLQRLSSWGRLRGMLFKLHSQSPRGLISVGLSIWVGATLVSWTYENPLTSRIPASATGFFRSAQEDEPKRTGTSAPLWQINHLAIVDALKYVPKNTYLLTTSQYLPHLSQRPKIGTISRAPKLDLNSGVEAIFLNLKDLRQRNCEDYRQNLQLAAGSGFGLTFYHDGVLLIEKNKGSSERLNTLVDRWPGCR
jgi:uncharacterized membrane protein